MKNSHLVLLYLLVGILLIGVTGVSSLGYVNHQLRRELRSSLEEKSHILTVLWQADRKIPMDLFERKAFGSVRDQFVVVIEAGRPVFTSGLDDEQRKQIEDRIRGGPVTDGFCIESDELLAFCERSAEHLILLGSRPHSAGSKDNLPALLFAVGLWALLLPAVLWVPRLTVELPLMNRINASVYAVIQSLAFGNARQRVELPDLSFLKDNYRESFGRLLSLLRYLTAERMAYEEFTRLIVHESEKRRLFEIMYDILKERFRILELDVLATNNSYNRLEMLYSLKQSNSIEELMHDPSVCPAYRSGQFVHLPPKSSLCLICSPSGEGDTFCFPLPAGKAVGGICRIKFDRRYQEQQSAEHLLSFEQKQMMDQKTLTGFVSLAGAMMNGISLLDAYRNQAITDSLTGLYNRRYILEYLTNMINISKRSGTPVVVFMIDIDRFKRFNDEFGHKTGDAVLNVVARCLRSNMREGDVIGRYGGEEFVAILPDTSVEQGMEVAERLRSKIACIDYEEHGLRSIPRITISVGVAKFPDHGYSYYHLINSADKALYSAKKNGRNSVVLHQHLPDDDVPV